MGDHTDAIPDEDDINNSVVPINTGPEHSPPAVPESSYQFSKYDMKRGIALIINNTFPQTIRTGLREREGSNNDFNKMVHLLDTLNFKVTKAENLKAAEMKDLVDAVAEMDFTDMDCFVCVIFSYGKLDFVYGLDERVEVERLVQPFKGNKCLTLAGKPKLFFLQICPIREASQLDAISAQGKGDDSERKIPVEADLLIVQSCIPGYLTWSTTPQKLSLFIEALVSVIESHRRDCDMLTMMTRVLRKLANALEGYDADYRSLPYITSTLSKDLYLS